MISVEAVARRKAAAEEGNKPAAGTMRRTKLVRVEQQLINELLTEEPEREVICFADGDEEILQLMEWILDPEELEDSRALFARCAAKFQAAYDMDADIINQYKEKGYAMVEVEVEAEAEDADDEEAGH